jgi:hypothetical protein
MYSTSPSIFQNGRIPNRVITMEAGAKCVLEGKD